MQFTDYNNFAKLSVWNPPLPAVVQQRRRGGAWLSNHDLIALDANLPVRVYDTTFQTDRFFVFDAIYQRRSSPAEVNNPLLLRGQPGLGTSPEYNLLQLAFWHGLSVNGTVSSNSTYYAILNNWNGSFAPRTSLQTILNTLLPRLNNNALLAPLDRNDLIRFVVMNALFEVGPTGSVQANNIVLRGQAGTPLRYVAGGNDSPIGIGIMRLPIIQTYRATLARMGFVLVP
jgi:hypothetical protein